MAKQKRSIEDLDAELAAVEAELAALEGRAPPPPRKKAAPKKEAPAAPEPAPAKEESKSRFALPFGKKKGEASEAADESSADAETTESPAKSRFAIGKPKLAMPFGKKKREDAPAEAPATEPLVETDTDAPPAIVRAPAVAVVEEDRPRQAEVVPVTDASNWRAEHGAWVRANPDTPTTVVRRILDEEGEVVREEPATQDDLDEVTGVKAEKGLGKLLGGGKSLKMPSLSGKLPGLGRFGRKQE